MAGRILLSGCSAGGKSTLLSALAARGHAVVEEPGRRVIAAGGPRPEADLAGFLEACVALALADFAAAGNAPGPVIFDRGLPDALSGLDALGAPGGAARTRLWGSHRYAPVVLMAPPWPELFVQDGDRTHGLAPAIAEHDRLRRDYRRHGYRMQALRRAPVAVRVAEVEAFLQAGHWHLPVGPDMAGRGDSDRSGDDPGH
jgi:predicted ATPase